MIRKIITIDEAKCNGCGLCARACHEGAIGMENGKAKLLREDYCDGLGDCLPACPTGAIAFVEREAPACDEATAKASQAQSAAQPLPCGCPGTQAGRIHLNTLTAADAYKPEMPHTESRLSQWPVQIKLVPVNAPYFRGADLLVAADCTAYAYGDFHSRFIKGRITLIGCPKLDEGDYTEKLTAILANNEIKSLTIVRMQVPCCGGIEQAAKTALQRSGKCMPWQVKVISTDGRVLDC